MSSLGQRQKLLPILTSIILIICNLQNIFTLKTEEFIIEEDHNKDLFTRMNYYQNLLKDLKLSEGLIVGTKENKLILQAVREFGPNTYSIALPKSLFMNSCSLFPFKEVLLKAFYTISNKHYSEINKFSNSLFLTYEIMYLKFGNKEKAKKYYEDLHKEDEKKKSELDSILPFGNDHEINLYLRNLPNKSARSLFFLKQEEIEMAKNLKIDLISKTIFENLHFGIIEFIKENLNSDIKSTILEFMDKTEEFFSILTYVNNNEFYMNESVYAGNFLSTNKLNYYSEFKAAFIRQDMPMFTNCKFIAPILDLITIKPMQNIDKSDSVNPSLNKSIENPSYVLISFNKRFYPEEIFYQTTTDFMQTEVLFGITGTLVRNNPTDSMHAFYSVNNNDFTKKTIEICKSFGCGGYNIDQILSAPEGTKIPFFFIKNSLNYDGLKFLKIKYLKNKVDDYSLVQAYLQDKFVDYDIDINGAKEYLNLIRDASKELPDFENLIKEYLKLRGIYKGMHNFNQPGLIKIFSGLENKINLIELALIKGNILKIHEDFIMDKLVKDTTEDLKRLKMKYLS